MKPEVKIKTFYGRYIAILFSPGILNQKCMFFDFCLHPFRNLTKRRSRPLRESAAFTLPLFHSKFRRNGSVTLILQIKRHTESQQRHALAYVFFVESNVSS
jgi:hypothetical protein